MNRILILDDEEAVRQSLVDFFEDRMWETIEAESAELALELIAEQKPDAAIVDIRLPGMDGRHFILELKNRNWPIPCLICTGSPEYVVPEKVRSLSWVSNILFKKPVPQLDHLESELLRLIEQERK